MNKKRKTRREKVLADLHRRLNATKLNSYTAREELKETKTETTTLEPQLAEPKITVSNYPYLIKDITKTAWVTALIIAFQIFLLLMLKIHVITLPGISY